MSVDVLAVSIPRSNSAATIRQAEQLRRIVSDRVLDVERSITQNKAKRAELANAERAAIKKELQLRIKENLALIRQAEICARSIFDSVKDTSLWTTKLHHERYKQFAALSVCERRLHLRMENPPELARDVLQDNLESEQKLLEKARKELMALEAEVAEIIQQLEAVRADLVKDAASRRLQTEADRAKLVNVALAGAVAPGTKSMAAANDEEGHEAFTKEQSLMMFQQRVALEDKAAALREKSRHTINLVKMDCARARERVEKSLLAQTNQSLDTTRQLISSGKEVDTTIFMAGRSLGEQGKFIDARDRRMEATYKDATSRLEQLKASRESIQQDYKKHTIKLLTSEACRKVTPQVASSPPVKKLHKRPASAVTGTGARARSRTGSSSSSQSCSALPSLGKVTSSAQNPEVQVPLAQIPVAFEDSKLDSSLAQGIRKEAPEVTPSIT